MSNKIEYHCMSSCNKCGEDNEVTVTDTMDSHFITEAETVCEICGFKDYWSYGWFDSGESMASNCEKYSF